MKGRVAIDREFLKKLHRQAISKDMYVQDYVMKLILSGLGKENQADLAEAKIAKKEEEIARLIRDYAEINRQIDEIDQNKQETRGRKKNL